MSNGHLSLQRVNELISKLTDDATCRLVRDACARNKSHWHLPYRRIEKWRCATDLRPSFASRRAREGHRDRQEAYWAAVATTAVQWNTNMERGSNVELWLLSETDTQKGQTKRVNEPTRGKRELARARYRCNQEYLTPQNKVEEDVVQTPVTKEVRPFLFSKERGMMWRAKSHWKWSCVTVRS